MGQPRVLSDTAELRGIQSRDRLADRGRGSSDGGRVFYSTSLSFPPYLYSVPAYTIHIHILMSTHVHICTHTSMHTHMHTLCPLLTWSNTPPTCIPWAPEPVTIDQCPAPQLSQALLALPAMSWRVW